MTFFFGESGVIIIIIIIIIHHIIREYIMFGYPLHKYVDVVVVGRVSLGLRC